MRAKPRRRTKPAKEGRGSVMVHPAHAGPQRKTHPAVRRFSGAVRGRPQNLSTAGKQDGRGLGRGHPWVPPLRLVPVLQPARHNLEHAAAEYSIDGPGVADFPGQDGQESPRQNSRRESRTAERGRQRRDSGHRATAAGRAANPAETVRGLIALAGRGTGAHLPRRPRETRCHTPDPATGQSPWKFIGDTRRPWWRR